MTTLPEDFYSTEEQDSSDGAGGPALVSVPSFPQVAPPGAGYIELIRSLDDSEPCRQPGADPEDWYALMPGNRDFVSPTGKIDEQVAQAAAERLCAGCHVKAKCLEFALNNEAGWYGVWGGTTAAERARIQRERTAARRTAAMEAAGRPTGEQVSASTPPSHVSGVHDSSVA